LYLDYAHINILTVQEFIQFGVSNTKTNKYEILGMM